MASTRPSLLAVCCLMASVGLVAQEPRDEGKRAGEAKTLIGEHHYRIYRGDGTPATLEDVLKASAASSVTFLGESHEDPVAHHLEEKILRSSHTPDLGLSLEMFETDVQFVVNEYLAGLITEEHLTASGRAWRNYRSDYRPLVEFAKERKMPVIAANPPRRYVNRVTRLGSNSLAELDGKAREFLPPLPYTAASLKYAEAFNRVMDEAERQQRKDAETSGSKQPPRAIDRVKGLQAQSLWDAGMAFSIASFLTRNPGMRVLHCNGSFHTAERLGIPEHLARYRPGVSMLVVTMIPDKNFPEFDPAKMKGQGDFVIVTDPKRSRSEPDVPGRR